MAPERRTPPLRVRLAAVGVALAVCLGGAPGVASAAPGPTDDEIAAAQQATDAAVAQLTDLATRLAQAQAEVDAANAAADIAMDTYQAKQADYEAAQTAADAAAAAAQQAAADLAAARADVAAFARASYMQGTTAPDLQAMLSSADPAELLQRATLLEAAGGHQADVLIRFAGVQRRAAAADVAAQTALASVGALKQQAADALAAAERVEVAARQRAEEFVAEQAGLREQVQRAQRTLAELTSARAAAAEYARQQAAAQAAVQRARSGTVDGASPLEPTGPRAGAGSSTEAEEAIDTALAAVGTRYAWGGGTAAGPSEGFGIDTGVVGFDCSALTRRAYASAGVSVPRNSRAQYAALPKVARADLQPGDLVFWAVDVTDPATIHHVALYLGGGRIVEAPHSGSTVHVTRMYWSGYLGAVRPTG